MEWYIWLIIGLSGAVLVLVVAAIFGIALFLVHELSYPKRYGLEESLNCDIDKGILHEQLGWQHHPLTLTMKDGYEIHGDFYPNDFDKILVFVHGYTWTRYGGLKYANYFYRKGFSLYLYDQRSHGENIHQDVTMGYKEAIDLHEIIQILRKKYGKDVRIGLHGESMGAATAILEMKHEEDNLAFVIADSPFASLDDLMKFKAKQMHVPHLILIVSDHYLYRNHHYHFKDVEPIKSLVASKVPLLLIHGDSDTMIPLSQSEKLYKAREENTTLHVFKGVEHTLSYQTYPLDYNMVVDTFMKQNNLC